MGIVLVTMTAIGWAFATGLWWGPWVIESEEG